VRFLHAGVYHEAFALLLKNRTEREEIREAVAGNVAASGIYPIVNAIEQGCIRIRIDGFSLEEQKSLTSKPTSLYCI
jgi:hypothetical protein